MSPTYPTICPHTQSWLTPTQLPDTGNGAQGHKMNGFEYIFTLFGLLLGLALAEGLGGLARALKARHRVHIGWPTASVWRDVA